MAAFALGLALLSFFVVWGLLTRNWSRPPDWFFSTLASLAMLFGGCVASAVAWRARTFAGRVLLLVVLSLLVAFLAAALAIAVILAFAKGLEELILVPSFFAVALVVGVMKFGVAALVVTALWSLAYAVLERRIAAR